MWLNNLTKKLSAQRIAIFVIIIFMIFSAIITIYTLQTYMIEPWKMNSDHIQFGSIIQLNINPDLFSTDFVFNSNRYTDFYTPTFINILTTLTKLTNNNYILALVITQLPLIIIFFICTYYLYFRFTESHPISILFTLLSIGGVAGLNSEWEVVGLEWMLARTYALPALILTYMVYLAIYKVPSKPLQPYRYWILLGSMIGLTTNFHPTTGMTLAITIGSILLAYTLKHRQPGLLRLGLVVVFTIIFALPTVQHVVGNSQIGDEAVFENSAQEFSEFSDVFEWRIRAYPFQEDFGRGWTAESEEVQFLIRFLWIPFTVIAFFLAKADHRSPFTFLFMAVQLIYIVLLIDNIDLMGVLILGGYTLYRWWKKDDKLILMLYEVSAGILLVTVALPLVFRPLWLHFELGSLTTIVVELSRGTKQLQIPITLILALSALDLWKRWQLLDADQFLLRIILVVSTTYGVIIFALAATVAYLYEFIRTRLYQNSYHIGINLTFSAIIILMGMAIFINPPLLSEDYNIYMPRHMAVLICFVSASIVWLLMRTRSKDILYTSVFSLMIGSIIAGALQFGVIHSRGYERENNDIITIAEWAKVETPEDALFALYRNDRDRSHFRLHSERSIHFSRKDLNIIGYAQPRDLLDAYKRYNRLNKQLFKTNNDILKYFEEESVDYLVINKNWIPANYEDLQPVLQTQRYIVFQCPIDICG